MRRVLRYFLRGVLILASLSGLAGYFVYAPGPEVPRLSGKLIEGMVETGGLKRTYLTYREG